MHQQPFYMQSQRPFIPAFPPSQISSASGMQPIGQIHYFSNMPFDNNFPNFSKHPQSHMFQSTTPTDESYNFQHQLHFPPNFDANSKKNELNINIPESHSQSITPDALVSTPESFSSLEYNNPDKTPSPSHPPFPVFSDVKSECDPSQNNNNSTRVVSSVNSEASLGIRYPVEDGRPNIPVMQIGQNLYQPRLDTKMFYPGSSPRFNPGDRKSVV